jgi:hypothetical protein
LSVDLVHPEPHHASQISIEPGSQPISPFSVPQMRPRTYAVCHLSYFYVRSRASFRYTTQELVNFRVT